jgi:hypothetical protein
MSSNPKDAVGQLRPQLNLIPPSAQILESVVMAHGAEKYGPFNWRESAVRSSIYVAAAMRHLLAWADGQDNDPESGVTHLAHIRACMGIMIDAHSLGKLEDDRPKQSGEAAKLIEQHTKQAHQPVESDPQRIEFRTPG